MKNFCKNLSAKHPQPLALEAAVDEFLSGGSSTALQKLALDVRLAVPLAEVEAKSQVIGIHRLNLPLTAHLIFASDAEPSIMETLRMYHWPGFDSPEELLTTRVTSTDGSTFDISNQYEHSWVALNPRGGVAAFHFINAVPEQSYLYGRLLCVRYLYWGSTLSVMMLGLQAEDAVTCGFRFVRHKVAEDNHFMIRLLRRLGHENFEPAPGAPGFLFVQTQADVVLAAAEQSGYRRIGLK